MTNIEQQIAAQARGLAGVLDPNGLWPRPIPVSERLPEPTDDEGWSEAALGYVDDGCETPGWDYAYCEHGPNGGHRWLVGPAGNRKSVIVTHWLPLPPPVKE